MEQRLAQRRRPGATPPAATAGAADRLPAYPRRTLQKIMVGLMLAMLTSMLSNSIIATALPTIMGELGNQDKFAWVATAALLTMTASTPVWGKLSDTWGRKPLFQTALVIFILSSVAAGFAQDVYWLTAARAGQGLAVGGLATLPNIILADVTEPRERGRYSGFLGVVFGVATVLGPLVGGFLVDSPLGWRWCFFITVPLAVVAFAVIQWLLHLPVHPREDSRVDWTGALWIAGGAGSAILLLSLGGTEFPWKSVPAYALIAVTVLLVLFAVFTERRAPDPILPARLFTDRTFVLASTGSLVVGMMMFGLIIYLPQYLQMVQALSPTESGLMTLPLVFAFLTTSIGSGLAVGRTGRWKAYPVCGMALAGLGFTVLSLLESDSGLVPIGAGSALVGLGMGLCIQILVLAAQNALRRPDMASGTSAVAFFRNFGGAMGVAAFGAIMVNRLHAELDRLAAQAAAQAAARAADGAEEEPPLPDLSAVAQGSPEAVHALPDAVREMVVAAFDHAMQSVFVAGIPLTAVGLLAVVLMRGTPLRSGRPERTRT